MRRFTAILISIVLALAMVVLTSCAGAPGIDFPHKGRGEDISADEPGKDVPTENAGGDAASSSGEQDNAAAQESEPGAVTSEPDVTTQSQSQKETEPTETEPEPEHEPEDPIRALINSINADTATAAGKCGADLEWYFKDGILVIRGSGEMDNYSEVRAVSDAPWQEYDDGRLALQVARVVVCDGVTSIGDYAFAGMKSISAVELPDSIEVIGESAFYYCRELSSIVWPKKLKAAGEDAFCACASIDRIYIPASLQYVGNNAFSVSYGPEIDIEDGVKRLDLSGYCITREIVVPASVKTVESFSNQLYITFLGDAPEIAVEDVINDEGEKVGIGIKGLNSGYDVITFEPCPSDVTIYYSGDGFDEYIEMFPQYEWVKK